jgi:hypothetical protein
LALDGTGLALDWPVIDIRLAQERQKIGTGFAELTSYWQWIGNGWVMDWPRICDGFARNWMD